MFEQSAESVLARPDATVWPTTSRSRARLVCDFIGAVHFSTSPTEDIPAEAAARIRWRGPDSYAEQVDDSRVLASARLAIIDLNSEADQPLISASGAWDLVFNGEIYNYKDLAATHGLSEKARRSDTW